MRAFGLGASFLSLSLPSLDHLVELAFQYGPFLFALLFLLSIVRWAQQKFQEIQKQNPPSSSQTVNSYRFVYLASFAVGVALVIVSVVWWWQYRPTIYVYRGVIENLDETQTLDGETAYFHAKRIPPAMADVPEERDEKFIVVQTVPFLSTDTVEVFFAKTGGTGKSLHRLHIPYKGEAEPHFEVVWNQDGNKYEIRSVQPENAALFNLGVVLEARQVSKGTRPVNGATGPSKSEATNVIPTLQTEQTPVGAKIEALDQLNSLPKEVAAQQLRTVTKKEPVAVTLLDLSRHSDPELASKAAAAVKTFDLKNYTSTLLSSMDAHARTVGENILFRMDPGMAADVVKGLQATDPRRANEVSQQLAKEAPVTLRPTGSAQGDRYYLHSSWNPDDKSAVTCLTSAFNNGMGATRSLTDEATLMAGRKDRLVYGDNKDWTIWMADEAHKCGAQTEFVAIKPPTRK
jgi:hypothetical protein